MKKSIILVAIPVFVASIAVLFYFLPKKISFSNQYQLDSAPCGVGAYSFTVDLTSNINPTTSNDPIFDSTNVWIIRGGKTIPIDFGNRTSVLKTQINGKDIKVRDNSLPIHFYENKGSESLCDKTLAYATRDGDIIILLKEDYRPFGDKFVAISYNPTLNKVTDALYGVIPNEINDDSVKFDNDFVQFSTTYKPTDTLACEEEEKCGEIDGKKILSTNDTQALDVWYTVSLKNGKFDYAIDRTATYNSFIFKDYFSGQGQFENNFKYNQESKQYKTMWYIIATLDNGRECIYPSVERELPVSQNDWICKTK